MHGREYRETKSRELKRREIYNMSRTTQMWSSKSEYSHASHSIESSAWSAVPGWSAVRQSDTIAQWGCETLKAFRMTVSNGILFEWLIWRQAVWWVCNITAFPIRITPMKTDATALCIDVVFHPSVYCCSSLGMHRFRVYRWLFWLQNVSSRTAN